MRVVIDCEANDLFVYAEGRKPTKFHCAVALDLDTGDQYSFVPPDWTARVMGLLVDSGAKAAAGRVRANHRLPDFLEKCDEIWMHNAIGYDRRLIDTIFDYSIPIPKLRDSLVLSRFANHVAYPKDSPRLRRGHSVEYWAKWLGLRQQKVAHEDWSKFSLDMFTRCQTDTLIQAHIVRKLESELAEIPASVILEEHLFASMLDNMHEDGFYLYRDRAKEALEFYENEMQELQDQIREVFQPKPVLIKHFIAKYRKPRAAKKKQFGPWEDVLPLDHPILLDKRSLEYLTSRGLPLSTKEFKEFQDKAFDIGSPKERKERLLEVGWQPVEFSEATGEPKSPKADCPSLSSEDLPPEARLMAKWLQRQSWVGTIKQWLEGCDENGYVHGKILHVGAWTHRCAHIAPNMGNIPGKPKAGVTKQDVFRMRGCWGVEGSDAAIRRAGIQTSFNEIEKEVDVFELDLPPDTPVLVGCDAAGIQGRALAHYIYEGTGQREYVDLVSNPETDLHVYNQKAAGLASRDAAKTFYYSYVLGVGYWKIARQVGVEESEYPELLEILRDPSNRFMQDSIERSLSFKDIPLTDENYAIAARGFQIKKDFEANVPGLSEFQSEYIPSLHKQKRVYLPDGRYLAVSQRNHVMPALLQGFETVVMRRTGIEVLHLLKKRSIPATVRNFVHDEYQFATILKYAETVRSLFQERIEAVRNLYDISCPLGVVVKPNKDVSISWAGTH